MKTVTTILLTFALLLAGCSDAFKLPTGCENDEPVTDTSPPAAAEPTENIPDAGPSSQQTLLEKTPDTDQLPVKTVVEGDLVSFPNLKATDPDGDKIKYTFTEPLDKLGKWRTTAGDAGEYVISITASDGKSKASQKIKIVVLSKNKAPVISFDDEITVNEGELVVIKPTIIDQENDEVTVTYSGWMSGETKETSFGDAGTYTVEITADDGTSLVKKNVAVIVKKINRAPHIDSISDVAIKEGDKITVKPTATDPDKDTLVFTFSAPLDSDGIWQTKIGDAGNYQLNATVSDGRLIDIVSFKVTVEGANRAPVLTLQQVEISVEEGDVVTIPVEATDSDEDTIRITYSGWMTAQSYTTDFDDQGLHTVTVTATDGINTVTKDVMVTVRNVNRAPVFTTGSFN